MSNNSNSLEQNSDSKVIFNLLNKVKNDGLKVVAWKNFGKSKLLADLEVKVVRKFKGEIVLEAVNNSISKLKLIIGASSSLNIYLVENGVLFRSDVKSYSLEEGLVIGFPPIISQVERRKALRLKIQDELNCTVDFSKTSKGLVPRTCVFNKNCFDISSGGLSFFITKMELRFFEKGDPIHSLTLSIEGEKIFCSGQVVNLLEVHPDPYNKLKYKGWKISIHFNDLSAEDKQALEMFVFNFLDFNHAV